MGGCDKLMIYKMVLQNNSNNWPYVWCEMISIYALLYTEAVSHDIYIYISYNSIYMCKVLVIGPEKVKL